MHGAYRLIKLFNWEIFDNPPYSPDLAPSDYHLFTKMKVWLATQRFHTNEELLDGVNIWLRNLAAPSCDEDYTSVTVQQVHKHGWQICAEVMQLCV